jgi:hypothetical protein
VHGTLIRSDFAENMGLGALAALARSLDHSPCGETAHPTAQD